MLSAGEAASTSPPAAQAAGICLYLFQAGPFSLRHELAPSQASVKAGAAFAFQRRRLFLAFLFGPGLPLWPGPLPLLSGSCLGPSYIFPLPSRDCWQAASFSPGGGAGLLSIVPAQHMKALWLRLGQWRRPAPRACRLVFTSPGRTGSESQPFSSRLAAFFDLLGLQDQSFFCSQKAACYQQLKELAQAAWDLFSHSAFLLPAGSRRWDEDSFPL